MLSYKPLHLEAQQCLQEEGCVLDIRRCRELENGRSWARGGGGLREEMGMALRCAGGGVGALGRCTGGGGDG